MELHFEWDPAKALANRRKHGVTFEAASTAFLDGAARLLPDPDHSGSEDRFVLLGMSLDLRLLVVVHTFREATGAIRLISARRATRAEARAYGEPRGRTN